MTQIRHDIARHATGTAAHKKDTQSQGGLEMEHVNERVGYARHDDKLGTGADEDVQRAASKDTEVVSGKGQTHRQHNDS